MEKGEKDCCLIHENQWFRLRTGAIIVEDSSVLFIKSKSNDFAYTVGGGIHMGEKAEDCVKREVFEETGVFYEVERMAAICENFFVGKSGNLKDMNCHSVELYFLMKSRGSKEVHCESVDYNGQKEELLWIPLEKIEEFDIQPDFLKTKIHEILDSNRLIHVVMQ